MERKVNNVKIMLSGMIIMAILIMPFSLNGQAGKTDFTGTWQLNAEKSDLGQGPGQGRGGFGGGNLVVKQEANLLTVERTMGDRTVTSKYTLDGKESINSTGRGESKSVATWSADGKTLTIVTTRSFERDGQTRQQKSTEMWKLTSPDRSKDQKVLSIVSSFTTQDGERKSTRVYDKK